MQRYRISDIPAEVDDSPIFIGKVTKQAMVTDANPDLLRANLVTFHDGARNKLHEHGSDQILVATSGRGFVATEAERIELTPGDVVHISKGERHWHGAMPGETFAHMSILTPGKMVIHEEE